MSAPESLTVKLPPDLEQFVNSIVDMGLYRSVNEAIQAGLRLLEERATTLGMSPEEIRGKIAVGLEQADRGELLDGEEVFKELEQRFGVTFDAP